MIILSYKIEYDIILSLAKKSNFKKIIIMRDSWNAGKGGVVNRIKIRFNEK